MKGVLSPKFLLHLHFFSREFLRWLLIGKMGGVDGTGPVKVNQEMVVFGFETLVKHTFSKCLKSSVFSVYENNVQQLMSVWASLESLVKRTLFS